MIWYAVHTNARKEGLANKLLKHQGFETLYLHYSGVVKHARKVRKVEKPYFPRYIFAGVSNGLSVYNINKTIGVSTVVYLGDNPLEIPGSVIEELQARGNKIGLVQFMPVESIEQRGRYRQGQRVAILEGPLAGFLATVSLDTGQQVTVWLEMFKGQVKAAFKPEALSPARRRFG